MKFISYIQYFVLISLLTCTLLGFAAPLSASSASSASTTSTSVRDVVRLCDELDFLEQTQSHDMVARACQHGSHHVRALCRSIGDVCVGETPSVTACGHALISKASVLRQCAEDGPSSIKSTASMPPGVCEVATQFLRTV